MGAASLYFEGQERKRPRALAPGFNEDSTALLFTLDFVMSPPGTKRLCAVASGFYEDSRALSTTPDLPPSGGITK